jgi:hypothetical protein
MSLFDNMQKGENVAPEKDVLGGSRLVESGIYACTIEHAYQMKSTGGAFGVALALKTADGAVIKQTIYISTREGKTFYVKDGSNFNLPGYSAITSLCGIAAESTIEALEPETKTIKLWDYDAKAELATDVPMIMDLVGKEIHVGIIKQVVDKNKKGDDGKYHPTGEVREENEFDKFFHPETHQTLTEAKANEKATFYDKWEAKNKDVTRNKAKGADGKAGAPAAGGSTASAPRKSLFN